MHTFTPSHTNIGERGRREREREEGREVGGGGGGGMGEGAHQCYRWHGSVQLILLRNSANVKAGHITES